MGTEQDERLKLSILICSTPERENMLQEVLKAFGCNMQRYFLFYSDSIQFIIYSFNNYEVIVAKDNKQNSVGKKRQALLNVANGDWIVFFDSDDEPYEGYVDKIIRVIADNPEIDCIGIHGDMTTDGKNPKTWIHSFRFKEWKGDGRTLLDSGYDYERPIIHFNPVLRTKALDAGFKDIRFGEDKDYADRLNTLLTKEYFLDSKLFHYRYTTKEPHNKKYGIG